MTDRYSILFILALLLGVSCSEDNPDPICTDPSNPDCPNYDPCLSKMAANADFIIEEAVEPVFSYGVDFVEGIGRHGTGRIKFSAKFKSDKYKWYLGSEILMDSSITRNFREPNIIYGADIPVSLVVELEDTLGCLDKNLRKDSVTKSIKIVRNCDFDIDNKFIGTWDNNPTDTITIEIDFYDPFNPSGSRCIFVQASNLNGLSSCKDFRLRSVNFTNNYLEIPSDGAIYNTCHDPLGWMVLDSALNVTMNLKFAKDSDGDGALDSYDSLFNVFNGRVVN